jgi:glycerophosphoryl diester phosphodiesterase
MEAAFAYGADMIELDVHLTTDGQFAVFHDWILDCRTNGSGRTRDYTMAELKELDIGHGYSFDGGETFPFRGKFIGAMPSLSEVVNQFPDKAFLINFKSRSVKEGEAMIKFMNEYQTAPQFAFTGHQNVLDVIEMEFPNHKTMSRQSAKACLKSYVTNGWFGKVPSICHNRLVPIPANYRHLIWGWPHRFDKRLAKHNSQHVLLAPLIDGNSQGLDNLADLQIVPEDFGGWVMTNKIEVVGPALKP